MKVQMFLLALKATRVFRIDNREVQLRLSLSGCHVVTSLAYKHSRIIRRYDILSQAAVTFAVGFVAEPALWKRLATFKTQNISPTRCFFNLISVWSETHCTLHASRDAIPASPALPLVPSLTFLQPKIYTDVSFRISKSFLRS